MSIATELKDAGALRLGVVGLGRAFTLMLPTLAGHRRVRMVAACDPRPAARDRFTRDFAARSYPTIEALCDDPDVQALYIATPHQLHAHHVQVAARAGKHVLVEKPMAITLAECESMVAEAKRGGIVLVIGHSHSFNAPILRSLEIIRSGRYGPVRMLTAINFTDFLYRPRRPEELDTQHGGGVVFSQGAHQVDIARLLCGGKAQSVRAHCGRWDVSRPADTAYSAQVGFESGTFATLTYSGFAHFDSDELMGWIGELGQRKEAAHYGAARRRLAGLTADQELALKDERAYGAAGAAVPRPEAHNHFGVVIASCERADLRPLANGVMVYDDDKAWLDPIAPPSVPRAEVIDEFCDAVAGVRPALHSGEWAMATLEVCLAILESSTSGREVTLRHQIEVPA